VQNFSDFYDAKVAVLAVFGYHLSAFLDTKIPVKKRFLLLFTYQQPIFVRVFCSYRNKMKNQTQSRI